MNGKLKALVVTGTVTGLVAFAGISSAQAAITGTTKGTCKIGSTTIHLAVDWTDSAGAVKPTADSADFGSKYGTRLTGDFARGGTLVYRKDFTNQHANVIAQGWHGEGGTVAASADPNMNMTAYIGSSSCTKRLHYSDAS